MPVMAINELADGAHLLFPNFSNANYLLVMQNIYGGSQALNAVFAENFLRYGGKDLCCQRLRSYAKEKNCRSKHSDDGSRQQIGRNDIGMSCGR